MLWDKFGKMPAVYDKEKRNRFVQAALLLEEFGHSNAVWLLLKLEFPMSTFYWVMRNYKEGGKVESKAGSGEMTDTNRRKGALSFELPQRTTEG